MPFALPSSTVPVPNKAPTFSRSGDRARICLHGEHDRNLTIEGPSAHTRKVLTICEMS